MEYFLEGDIIVKEGDIPDKFYVIQSGEALAMIEQEDFDYFDY